MRSGSHGSGIADVKDGNEREENSGGTSVHGLAPSQCCSSATAARRASLPAAHLHSTVPGAGMSRCPVR